MQYMAFDPFNNRVKMFKSDFSYNLPSNTGLIYEFNEGKVILYNEF